VTIQDLGSIGELVAAIATILTLVYLAAGREPPVRMEDTLHQLWPFRAEPQGD
jgi:hypothetical protein